MLTPVREVVAAILLAGCGLAATPTFADETDPPKEFTVIGSAAIVSQYRFRGLALSDNKPVVQGTVTVSHSSGFYVGTWGSSASAGSGPINIGGTEIDGFGGWTKGLGDSGLTVDTGVYGYIYPGATHRNRYEIYGSLAKAIGPASAKVGVYYAPPQKVFNYNFTSATRNNTYVYGELISGIPGTPLTLHSHLGHTGGGFDYGKQYLDYNVGLTYKMRKLSFDASLVGTDLGRSDINTGFGCGNNPGCIDYFYRMSKTVGVFSVTASF